MYGIITALPHEFAAVVKILENPRQGRFNISAGNRYAIGEISSDHGGVHTVAVALLPEMGNNIAAVCTNNMISEFRDENLEAIFMVGIAGGVPNVSSADSHVRLGDIVVSDKGGVFQYDNVKVTGDSKTGKKAKEIRSPPKGR